MPRVPTYQQQAQLNPQGDATIRVQTSPEGFGANVGRALQQVGATLGNAAIQLKVHTDDAAAKEANTNLERDTSTLLHDPEAGYFSKRGKAAYDEMGTINQRLKELQDSYAESLDNEQQRERFKQLSSRSISSASEVISRHAAKEYTTWQNSVNVGAARQAMENAAARKNDPEYVYLALERGKSEIEQLSERNGDSMELTIAKRAEYENEFHKKLVISMLQDDPKTARAYFQQNKDEIFAETEAAIESELKKAEKVGQAQEQADLIMQKANMEGSDPLKLAKQIQDPELRNSTESLLRVYVADQQRRQRQSEKAMVDAFWGAYVKNPDPATIPKVFPADQRKQAIRYAEMKASGKAIDTNWEVYQKLRLEAADPKTRSEFMQRSLYQYRMDLSDTELKQLINIQAGLLQGKNPDRLKLDRVFSNKQVLDQRLEDAGIKTNPKPGTDAAKRLSQFQRRLDERIKGIEQRLGRDVDEDEYLAEVDNLLRKVVVNENWWGDSTELLFEVDQTDIGDVPTDHREGIVQALRKNGYPVTEENIKEMYVLGLHKGLE